MFIYRFIEIRLSEPMIYDNTSKFVNRYQRPGLNIAATNTEEQCQQQTAN